MAAPVDKGTRDALLAGGSRRREEEDDPSIRVVTMLGKQVAVHGQGVASCAQEIQKHGEAIEIQRVAIERQVAEAAYIRRQIRELKTEFRILKSILAVLLIALMASAIYIGYTRMQIKKITFS